jgi:hypothetical protein
MGIALQSISRSIDRWFVENYSMQKEFLSIKYGTSSGNGYNATKIQKWDNRLLPMTFL